MHPHLIHAFLGPPKSKSQTASRSVQPFLHSSRQGVAILCNGPPLFPLKLVRSHGASEPPSNTDSLGPPEPITQMASQLVQPFLHSSRQTGPIFYNGQGCFFPSLKIASFHGGSGSHLIHGSLGHPSPQPKWHRDQFSRFCTSQG